MSSDHAMPTGLACAIMAGGRGERFWPKSRANRPKQFLSIAGRQTLLQATLKRLGRLVPPDRVLVVTGADFVGLVREQLPDLPPENILGEPVGRDTAPCVGLAALEAARRWGDPTLCVIPADHMVWDEAGFAASLQAAAAAAAGGELTVLGIEPDRVETGYGYIRVGSRIAGAGETPVFRVDRFVEKPSRRGAAAMLRSGRYLWNCGVFVFRAHAGLEAIEHHLPELWQGLHRLSRDLGGEGFGRAIAEVYPSLPRVSFDRGVLEHVHGLRVVPGRFPWDDVGSWLALDRLPRDTLGGGRSAGVPGASSAPGAAAGSNVVVGGAVTVGSERCIVDAPDARRLVVLFGVQDLVVVDTDDVLLVAGKQAVPDLKTLVARLKDLGHGSYLEAVIPSDTEPAAGEA